MQFFKLIEDEYNANSSAGSYFLNIYCTKCGNHLMLYQKDGEGALQRIFLDRIVAPKSFVTPLYNTEQSDLSILLCPNCKASVGNQGIHKDNRLAYEVSLDAVFVEKDDGKYPPNKANAFEM